MRRAIAAAIAATVMNAPVFGAGTGADLLDINTSARAAALGQAYTAMASSIDSMNWNPAGLVQTPSFAERPGAGITFSHQDHFSESNIDYFGLAMPARVASKSFAFGLSATRLGYARQERRLASGEKIGTIDSSDIALGLSAARNFGAFKAGTQVKMVRLSLDGVASEGYALDLGLMAPGPIRGLSLGLAARNIGPQMKFISEEFNLPLSFAMGAAYQVKAPLTISVDVTNRPHDGRTDLAIGAEMIAVRSVSLRTGYISRIAQAARDRNTRANALRNNGGFAGLDGLNAGLGLRIGQFSMDYSMSPFGELGNTQILTLSTWFGDGVSASNRAPSRRPDIAPEEPKDAHPGYQPDPSRVILGIDLPSESEPWWDRLKH